MKNLTLAAITTAAGVLGVVVGCFLVELIASLVPGEVIMKSVACAMMMALVYGFYRFVLASIEHDQSMQRIRAIAEQAAAQPQRVERRGADRKEFPTIQE